MTDKALVDVERRGRVLVVTMRRESKRNAVDRAMADALDAAFNLLEDGDELWAGVLAATGPVFSAGSDLRAGGDYATARGGEYGLVRRPRRKPLVAAVDGPALGGGLELVLACDLVVASTSATFGLPEVARGLVPTCGALFRGPRGLPANLARQLILTGEPITAARAYEVGFVNELVGPGQAAERAAALAERICRNSPVAVRACLAAVNELTTDEDRAGWSATASATDALRTSADPEEGIRAFLERRSPVWTGR
ncbi:MULTISPECIES: enoyl-CoA hydratase-related protein [Pseudofrankia]|uniref:enoyl-CoA hydratase-related protein n=1 Tax=Pseudofrankia TaxID=2994363 RepID=UPI000234CA8C|nr:MULTISPECIES: enoyl-CoA hydratase-related protein [Pseudofrankia]OHV28685.1 enoyl-CoA hydratase [Pseudofrankia sp. EUN1h]